MKIILILRKLLVLISFISYDIFFMKILIFYKLSINIITSVKNSIYNNNRVKIDFVKIF